MGLGGLKVLSENDRNLLESWTYYLNNQSTSHEKLVELLGCVEFNYSRCSPPDEGVFAMVYNMIEEKIIELEN